MTNPFLKATQPSPVAPGGDKPTNEGVGATPPAITHTEAKQPQTGVSHEAEVKQMLRDLRGIIASRLHNLTGDEVSEMIVNLANLLSTVGELLAHAERDYYQQWEVESKRVDHKGNPISNSKAEKLAKNTVAYFNRRTWELEFKSTKELINALKRRQKQIEIDMFAGGRNI